jgi:hypothetical protein
MDMLRLAAWDEGLELRSAGCGEALEELAVKVRKKHGSDIVVLIDEYDDAVGSNYADPELAEANSRALRAFYRGFKSLRGILRFALVTGVTRFGLPGVSEGLEPLTDISLDPACASVCGFTVEDMETCFRDLYPPLLESLISKNYLPVGSTVSDLLDKIMEWYDGYSWDGLTKILNPISVLRLFEKEEIDRYWRLTGASSNLLRDVMRNSSYRFVPDRLDNIPLYDIDTTTEVPQINPVSLLFHTGYLTVERIQRIGGFQYFSLKPPNREVTGDYYSNLYENLFKLIVTDEADRDRKAAELENAISSRDADSLTGIVSALFADLPASLQPCKDDGRAYHCMLRSYFYGLLSGELAVFAPGGGAVPDLILETRDWTYVVLETRFAPDDGREDVRGVLEQLSDEALKALAGRMATAGKGRFKCSGQAGDRPVSRGVGVYGRGQALACFGDS